jgi:glycosyltransferase involved in cell wall biosynthesis
MKVYFGFNDIRQDGMGTAAMNLLRALKNMNIEVQPVHPWKKILIPEYMEFNPIFLSDSEEELPLKEIIQKMVDVINNDPDCTVFSHFGSPNWGSVIPYLRPDIRVVVSVHCTTPSGSKIALAYKDRTSVFIPVSWEVERKLKKWLPQEHHHKITLIPNAIDVDKYPLHQVEAQAKIKILFFGRIEDYTKGCDRIPPIARMLKNKGLHFEWDLYGYFHWGYEKRYDELNEKYDVNDVISYKGCLQPSEIPEIISQYDIMVMPSNHEGFGLALIEAMASGLVCVASFLPNVTDIITIHGDSAFLVNKNDLKGFAKYIYQAATDIELRRKIGNNARKRVEDLFPLKKHGEAYKSALEKAEKDTSYIANQEKLQADQFQMPERLKPHILARIIPVSIKRLLKKYIS